MPDYFKYFKYYLNIYFIIELFLKYLLLRYNVKWKFKRILKNIKKNEWDLLEFSTQNRVFKTLHSWSEFSWISQLESMIFLGKLDFRLSKSRVYMNEASKESKKINVIVKHYYKKYNLLRLIGFFHIISIHMIF